MRQKSTTTTTSRRLGFLESLKRIRGGRVEPVMSVVVISFEVISFEVGASGVGLCTESKGGSLKRNTVSIDGRERCGC
jgi:hypothetical protein